jgi:hypothetical protein
LETALKAIGHNITFNDLYIDWITALTIDEQGFGNDRYCLRDIDATFQDFTIIDSLPYQRENMALYCYGSKVYQIQSPADCFCVEMTQPADGVAAISVAYRDVYGWHVKQIQTQGQAIMNICGNSIDTAHVIVSNLFAETPAGDIDFGSGPQESVHILIYERDEITSTTTTTRLIAYQLVVIGVGGISLTVVISVFLLIFKRKKNRQE